MSIEMLPDTRRVVGRVICLALIVGACADRSLVALTASIERLSVTVESVTLGTELSGEFELVLRLGKQANDAAEVSLQTFDLVRADDGTSLVSPLRLTSATTQFPVQVPKGGEVTVVLTIGDGAGLLQADRRDAICAGAVRIEGAVSDSLSDDATPVQSGPVMPACD